MLFATADELIIHKDSTYGKLKKLTDKVIEKGDFISMMLSAAKYPFRTCLTVFVRRNRLSYLVIADDMRQQTNTSSLLGLAVILPKELDHGMCQLVVLDTLIHKSE